MKYEYYEMFNLSNELAQFISNIISQKENADYVCKALIIIIPEHKGLVFSSPLDGYEPWGGGLMALSGAQMQEINKKYGKYVEGNIPEEDCAFFVVMKNEAYQTFLKLPLESKDYVEKNLESLSIICKEYDGILDLKILIKKFPYLKVFFDYLDEWRAKTGRVTLDSDILEEGFKKTLKQVS